MVSEPTADRCPLACFYPSIGKTGEISICEVAPFTALSDKRCIYLLVTCIKRKAFYASTVGIEKEEVHLGTTTAKDKVASRIECLRILGLKGTAIKKVLGLKSLPTSKPEVLPVDPQLTISIKDCQVVPDGVYRVYLIDSEVLLINGDNYGLVSEAEVTDLTRIEVMG